MRGRSMQLSGVRPSVGLSVCPIRQPHAAAAGLLLWALPAGVSLSVPSDSRTPPRRVCCCGLCRQVSLCLSHQTVAHRRGGFAAVGSAGRCFSVCPIRQPHAAAAGLLLWALPAGDSDRLLHGQQQPRCSSGARMWAVPRCQLT